MARLSSQPHEVCCIMGDSISVHSLAPWQVSVAEWLARPTAVWEDPGSNHTAVRGRLSVAIAAAIYSLGHGLCTLTAVPRSTQLSTLSGTVIWVSAYGLFIMFLILRASHWCLINVFRASWIILVFYLIILICCTSFQVGSSVIPDLDNYARQFYVRWTVV